MKKSDIPKYQLAMEVLSEGKGTLEDRISGTCGVKISLADGLEVQDFVLSIGAAEALHRMIGNVLDCVNAGTLVPIDGDIVTTVINPEIGH